MADDRERQIVLTVDEVAAQLQVTPTWVSKAARDGLIGSRKVGRYRRFLQEDVNAYLEQHRTVATNPLSLSTRSVAALNRRRRA